MPRFNRRGRSGVWFVASLANPAAPSAAAIAAGTAIHNELKSFTGFTSEVADLDNADWGSTFEKTMPGGESPAASSLTVFAGDADADAGEVIRAAIGGNNVSGFVVWVKRSKTPGTGERADVFPVRGKGANDDREAGNAVATYTVGFAIPDTPNKNVTLVA